MTHGTVSRLSARLFCLLSSGSSRDVFRLTIGEGVPRKNGAAARCPWSWRNCRNVSRRIGTLSRSLRKIIYPKRSCLERSKRSSYADIGIWILLEASVNSLAFPRAKEKKKTHRALWAVVGTLAACICIAVMLPKGILNDSSNQAQDEEIYKNIWI